MAEIVGAVASGITLVGAAIHGADAILNLISHIRNAPEEILHLHNEVTDTRLILSNIQENANQYQALHMRLALPDSSSVYGNPEYISKTERIIERINRLLNRLDITLREVTKSRSLTSITVHSGAWLLHRPKIQSMRSELRELKISLSVHFSANTNALTTRSVVLLKKVLLENHSNEQKRISQDAEVDAKLCTLTNQLVELKNLKAAQEHLLALVEGLNAAVVMSEERIKRTITTTTTTVSATDNFNPNRTNIQQTAIEALSATTSTTTTTVSAQSVSSLKLEFSRFQKKGCVPDCECSCHKRHRYRSPSFAQKVLGEVFVGFSSLPLLSKACTDHRCKHRSPFSATFTYYLPRMFLNRMLSLVCITTSQGDPALCIKTRPLSTDFSIYRAVEANDIGGVRRLLELRAAHPSATFRGGWTPLHYAISAGRTSICRSLLAAGADPMLEDGTNQQSPLEWVWTKILGGAYENSTQQEMEELFSDRDCLEEMGLTTLHHIVLGMNATPIEAYLAEHPSRINLVDANGRSALSWAAQRGMKDVVQQLLHWGADPNICTPQGHSPLQYAAEARNPDCLQLLLAYHADTEQSDIEGQTPLHYAAAHQSNLAFYQPLVEAGADVNWRTKHKGTPLCTAILEGYSEAAKYLIENGANIDLKGYDERPPVFFAVEYNNHAALKYLHARGADFTASSDAWPTIAHVAAYFADLDSLHLLTSFCLELEDVECVDRDGRDVFEAAKKRVKDETRGNDSFVEALSGFLRSIKVKKASEERADSDSEYEFEDAHDTFSAIA
ncbi:ankyrin repeat-containing domain protein [Pyrenochaeta sp. MPI-SDFR-AT-0127]|nr:ankyrin repeat-containing domain protein [Pyrenochaeta sp. MPI-SDFR-AT-0127]